MVTRIPIPRLGDETSASPGRWHVDVRRDVLRVAYEDAQGACSQYAALHLRSGYFRMVYGPDCGWGTSVIILPSYWESTRSGSALRQGGAVSAAPQRAGSDLVLRITGAIGALQVDAALRLAPPTRSAFHAEVSMERVVGDPRLASDHPGETFRPVFLSSMRISPSQWDGRSASVGARRLPIPQRGWIAPPRDDGTTFGIEGGSSAWKRNAPSIDVALDQAMTLAGWVTRSADPNDDNVGLWAASPGILRAWRYTIVSRRAGESA